MEDLETVDGICNIIWSSDEDKKDSMMGYGYDCFIKVVTDGIGKRFKGGQARLICAV